MDSISVWRIVETIKEKNGDIPFEDLGFILTVLRDCSTDPKTSHYLEKFVGELWDLHLKESEERK